MPKAEHEEGDPELHRLFERFGGQVVSPGGAAALLGLSRKTIYTLGERKKIRVFHSSEKAGGAKRERGGRIFRSLTWRGMPSTLAGRSRTTIGSAQNGRRSWPRNAA